jgi:hypothetical protein
MRETYSTVLVCGAIISLDSSFGNDCERKYMRESVKPWDVTIHDTEARSM